MPNHVSTRCVVTGPAASIASFQQRMIRPDGLEEGRLRFDFEGVLPMPTILHDTAFGSAARLGIEILTGAAVDGKPSVECGALGSEWAEERGITTRAEFVAWAEKHRPDAIEKARKCLAAHEATGFYDGHDWSVATWGTKWNSYDLDTDIPDDDGGRFEFLFMSAWTFPQPVFESLVKAFPDLVFHCVCVEEARFFAGQGEFNGNADFAYCEATDELFAEAFGAPFEGDDEE